jgi:hypothetical protein
MSLKAFHIVFVTLSCLLCFGFSGWSWQNYRNGGDVAMLALSIAALVAGLALLVYGRWFWRKITAADEDRRRRRGKIHTLCVALTMSTGVQLAQGELLACAACYGDAEGPLIDGARMGVFTLFGFVLAMQIAFGIFFFYLWRRARRFSRQTAGWPESID